MFGPMCHIDYRFISAVARFLQRVIPLNLNTFQVFMVQFPATNTREFTQSLISQENDQKGH